MEVENRPLEDHFPLHTKGFPLHISSKGSKDFETASGFGTLWTGDNEVHTHTTHLEQGSSPAPAAQEAPRRAATA